jgi:hypothetical protein
MGEMGGVQFPVDNRWRRRVGGVSTPEELMKIQWIFDDIAPQLLALYERKLAEIPKLRTRPLRPLPAGRKRILRLLPDIATDDMALEKLASSVAGQILAVSRNLARAELLPFRPHNFAHSANPNLHSANRRLLLAAHTWWDAAQANVRRWWTVAEQRAVKTVKIGAALVAHLAHLGATFAEWVAIEYNIQRGAALPPPEASPYQGIPIRRRQRLPIQIPHPRVRVTAANKGRKGIPKPRRSTQIEIIVQVLKDLYGELRTNESRDEQEIAHNVYARIHKRLAETHLLPVDPMIANPNVNLEFNVFYTPAGPPADDPEFLPTDLARRDRFSRIVEAVVQLLVPLHRTASSI